MKKTLFTIATLSSLFLLTSNALTTQASAHSPHPIADYLVSEPPAFMTEEDKEAFLRKRDAVIEDIKADFSKMGWNRYVKTISFSLSASDSDKPNAFDTYAIEFMLNDKQGGGLWSQDFIGHPNTPEEFHELWEQVKIDFPDYMEERFGIDLQKNETEKSSQKNTTKPSTEKPSTEKPPSEKPSQKDSGQRQLICTGQGRPICFICDGPS